MKKICAILMLLALLLTACGAAEAPGLAKTPEQSAAGESEPPTASEAAPEPPPSRPPRRNRPRNRRRSPCSFRTEASMNRRRRAWI